MQLIFLDSPLPNQPMELKVGDSHRKGEAVFLSVLEPSQLTCKSPHAVPTTEIDKIKGAIQKTVQAKFFKAVATVHAQIKLCLKLASRRF